MAQYFGTGIFQLCKILHFILVQVHRPQPPKLWSTSHKIVAKLHREYTLKIRDMLGSSATAYAIQTSTKKQKKTKL